MLSAMGKQDGRTWMAGTIPNPKSREYQCIHCHDSLYHVSEHQRAGEERVTEHFRHGKRTRHAIRDRSNQQAKALDFLLKQLSQEYEIEVFTDQIYTTSRGDLATDILAREHQPEGKYIDTIIQVEDNAFNFNDYLALERALSLQGISLMTVFCAQGKNNPQGHFYRNERRPASGKIVKNLGKNEKALYERNRCNLYFDPDAAELILVRFHEYEEVLAEDIVRGGYTIKEAGELLTFELKKEPEVIRRIPTRFKLEQRENQYGHQIAIPRALTIHDYFQKEMLAEKRNDLNEEVGYEIAERLGIMLESMPPERLRELTHQHGAERLGTFAVI